MLEDILEKGFAGLGLSIDAGAVSRYRTYFERLDEMNKVMNLTAISGEDDTARLHFLDRLPRSCAEDRTAGHGLDPA